VNAPCVLPSLMAEYVCAKAASTRIFGWVKSGREGFGMGTLFRFAWRMLIASILTSGVFASELPSRLYTTQDGLVRNEVLRIRRDSRGYLWFGTWEGLSIFDGYQFTNYTVADGLP